uniref:uncharacterized protein LOC120823918 isoform X2 n=1 Tax=Gasterosteus aculeatus aculeatus TaxID=481459 RepID=UPI001A9A13A8|nr:uncharacterized protein LOC120823918 isoform X2 [Gasterosteus aculeatus aculeatus]
MPVTSHRTSFSDPGADRITKSHVQFGQSHLSSLYYTTTAKDHYRKPDDYKFSTSTTKTDDPPLTPTGTPYLSRQKASSVVFGDPSKIIERESTYAASFRWTDEHTLRASNTNPYDVPLKTRGLCPPQHTASSVVFSDPLKIIERESTYAASFRWTDEHTLRASNTNPYDVPLKTRGLCPPQHTSNIRFPLAHRPSSTTYREEYTTKPLTL